jgi:hypothetical protein
MEDQTNNEPVAGDPAHNEPTANELFDSVLATIDPENCSAREYTPKSDGHSLTRME